MGWDFDKYELAHARALLDERDNEAECLGKTAENLAGRVAYLENELEEIRDLARTGLPPLAYGMTSLEEWEHYKINRIAGMANEALNKYREA